MEGMAMQSNSKTKKRREEVHKHELWTIVRDIRLQ